MHFLTEWKNSKGMQTVRLKQQQYIRKGEVILVLTWTI